VKSFLATALLGLALAGCGHDAGSGDVEFTVWGEEYVEDGIPAETFEDGWSAKFSEFLIVLGEVTVADASAGDGNRISGTQLFDLVTPGPHEIGRLDGLEARQWDTVGYEVRTITADTELHPSASADDLATMRAGDYSIYVAGFATKNSETKSFAWGFQNSTSYARCVSEAEGREQYGVLVTNGGTEHVELTIHGDHFFYDDLASPNAVLRFDAIANADANDDGDVTLDELGSVKLVAIEEGTYGTGSAGRVDDLGAFVQALTATLGHFRGEGHCVASDL
jgi:hypothetical protein